MVESHFRYVPPKGLGTIATPVNHRMYARRARGYEAVGYAIQAPL
jgi:hypothetical protein